MSGWRASSCTASLRPPCPEPGDDVLGSAGTSGAASSSGGRVWSSAAARSVTSLPLLARDRIVGAEIEQRPVAHPVADALGEHQPVASDGLAVLVGVGPGDLDVQGAGEGLAMCYPDTRAGARGKGDIDATTRSWPHKRFPGAHIHHIEVQAMEEPNM